MRTRRAHDLFSTLRLGPYLLPTRILMAPMTRNHNYTVRPVPEETVEVLRARSPHTGDAEVQSSLDSRQRSGVATSERSISLSDRAPWRAPIGTRASSSSVRLPASECTRAARRGTT